jgi:hypothetical protein
MNVDAHAHLGDTTHACHRLSFLSDSNPDSDHPKTIRGRARAGAQLGSNPSDQGSDRARGSMAAGGVGVAGGSADVAAGASATGAAPAGTIDIGGAGAAASATGAGVAGTLAIGAVVIVAVGAVAGAGIADAAAGGAGSGVTIAGGATSASVIVGLQIITVAAAAVSDAKLRSSGAWRGSRDTAIASSRSRILHSQVGSPPVGEQAS